MHGDGLSSRRSRKPLLHTMKPGIPSIPRKTLSLHSFVHATFVEHVLAARRSVQQSRESSLCHLGHDLSCTRPSTFVEDDYTRMLSSHDLGALTRNALCPEGKKQFCAAPLTHCRLCHSTSCRLHPNTISRSSEGRMDLKVAPMADICIRWFSPKGSTDGTACRSKPRELNVGFFLFSPR